MGAIVEATLGSGEVSTGHARMLEVRRAEGNQALFAAAAGRDARVRAYAARLLRIEEAIAELEHGRPGEEG